MITDFCAEFRMGVLFSSTAITAIKRRGRRRGQEWQPQRRASESLDSRILRRARTK